MAPPHEPPAADDAAAVLRRATELLAGGPSDEALEMLEAAVLRHPRDAALACRHADALHSKHRLKEAIEEYRRAAALDEKLFDTWYGLGCALHAQKNHARAAMALTKAVQLRGDAAAARTTLGEALFELGEVERALAELRIAAARGNREVRAAALASIATLIPGSAGADDAAIRRARRDWVAAAFEGVRPLRARRTARAGKLRLGYVSAFFAARHWMKPVFGVINAHDRQRFEIHLISDGGDPGADAGYRDHDEDVIWRVRGMGDDELARRIAELGLDVLVDLNAYSFRERFGLFLRRPAPVVLGWFNHFATSGARAFDALIGDATVLPDEGDEARHYDERIVRVPGSYLAFTVAYPVPPVAPPPSLAGGRIRLGCLGSAYKLTPEVVASWATILREAPNSDLLLKNSLLDDESNAAFLRARFLEHGVAPERLFFEGRAEHYEFLRAYDRIDVALDTFPYNGGTTTTEALWQGVPVAAFRGDRWVARTSASLLHAAGLDDWIAPDRATFERRVIELARDSGAPARLALLRSAMRERLAASAACDSEGLCRALEAIYVREVEARR
jgi:protein O-GlcNAc transferase